MLLPSALGFSPHPPVSVYGTGPYKTIAAFLDGWLTCFATLWFAPHHVFPLIRGFASLPGTSLVPVKFENNSSDFFAISKNVAGVLRKDYREKIRYLRGYVQSVGFRKTTLEFEAQKREAGESKYSIRKLLHFSVNALCSFSDLPLKLGMYSGVFVALCGFILMIFTIINKIVNGAPAGYSTIIVVLCFMFAVVLMVIGIIGEYIAVLFAEIKDRPIYIVRDIYQEEKETHGGEKE